MIHRADYNRLKEELERKELMLWAAYQEIKRLKTQKDLLEAMLNMKEEKK